MKSNIYKLTLIICMLCAVSCEVTNDLDEFKPQYVIDQDRAIVDAKSAELALTGAYSKLTNVEAWPFCSIFASLQAGTSIKGNFSSYALAIDANQPDPNQTSIKQIYAAFYSLIERANLIIREVPSISNQEFFSNPSRQDEIVAEAKILRAIGHFELLRFFGQFYDVNSNLGINVRLTPPADDTPLPRVSVQDTYEAILQDLNDAIASAPDLREKYFVNKTFAKGLKAKVLLYMGDYPEAAIVAKDVIDNSDSNFQLASTFSELFTNASTSILSSNESLFNFYSDASEDIGYGRFWGFGFTEAVASPSYRSLRTQSVVVNGQTISYDGSRIATIAPLGPPFFLPANSKYKFFIETFETFYYLRMAEVYLIYAEAEARSTNSVTTNALEALNAIRIRAGATTTGGNGFETYPATIPLNTFLEVVRMEKLVELGIESGEEWFDLIRYDFADGFNSGFKVSDSKATADNPDKFIFPIPQSSIETSNGVMIQNPSY